MSALNGWVAGGARVVVAAAAAFGLVQGVQSTGWSLDLASSGATGRAPAPTAVRDAALTCAGPEMAGIKGADDVATTTNVFAAAAPAEALGDFASTDPGGLTISSFGAKEGAPSPKVTASGDFSAPQSVLVHGIGGRAPGVVATQEWLVANQNMRGAVSAPCTPPSADAWLIAGAGQPGRQERLVLSNPGANEVVADVTMYGAKGPLPSTSGEGIVVPAHGRTAILLDAIGGSEATPVVHVQTTGGSIQATINDIFTDGSTPAGIDDTVPTAAPATSQVIPGVAIPASGEGAATVRIAATGTKDAVVQMRTLGEGGGAPLPKNGVVTVKAGTVAEVSLAGIPVGMYAVQLNSDAPIVAAATTTRRAGTDIGDFAWMPASDVIVGVAGAAYRDSDLNRTLNLVATGGSATVNVVTLDRAGAVKKQTVQLAAGTTKDIGVDVAGLWVQRVGGDGQLRAAVVSAVGSGARQFITAAPLNDAIVQATLSRVLTQP